MAERFDWQQPGTGSGSRAEAPWARVYAHAAMPNQAIPRAAVRQAPGRGMPGMLRSAPDPEIDASLMSPQGTRYWTHQGGGHALLVSIALAHVATGLFGVVLGVLGWYLLMPGALLPVIAGGAALLAALAGAVAFELARFTHPTVALGARVLLVSADLLAAGSLLWLLGPSSFAPSLFFIPVVFAALLFPWRAAVAISALGVVGFIGVCAAQVGFASMGWLPAPASVGAWLPWALALAGVSALLIFGCALVPAQTAGGYATMFQLIEQLTGQRTALRTEQQRLIEAMRILEDTQNRLTQERTVTNRQLFEVTRVVERLGEGDLSALRALHAGLFGPLNTLAGALTHLGQRTTSMQSQQQQSGAHQRSLESVCESTHEQGQILALTDNALRELSGSANELATAVQRIEHSGEFFGPDSRALAQALREIEQHALTQASDTAMLGARLAQLRARQSEIGERLCGTCCAPRLPVRPRVRRLV